MKTICDLHRELFKFIGKYKTMPTILALPVADVLNLKTFSHSLQTGGKLYFEGVEVRPILTREEIGFAFGFKQLELPKSCKTCGANDFIEKTDRHTCLYCGNDYDISTNKLIDK